LIRAAFDDRSIRRGIMVVEGNQMACQTWIEGTFAREFTQLKPGRLSARQKDVRGRELFLQLMLFRCSPLSLKTLT
jgi:hypothetical protein